MDIHCYVCKSIRKFIPFTVKLPVMKNKIASLVLLSALTLGMMSCATSRSKYGCPSTAYKQPVSNKI